MRQPARGLIVALAVVALLGAACTDDGSDAADGGATTEPTTTSEPVTTTEPETVEPAAVETDDELYAVPDPIPDGTHGDLVRYQEIVPGTIDGARTYRVMYLSESLEGEPIVVTGTVWCPPPRPPPRAVPCSPSPTAPRASPTSAPPSEGGGACRAAPSSPPPSSGA